MKYAYKKHMDNYLEVAKLEYRLSKNTIRSYENRLSLFLNWVTENRDYPRITSISKNDLKEYIQTIDSSAPSTVKSTLSACSEMWKWMISEDITTKNIADGIRRPKVPKKVIKYMRLNEIKKFLEASKDYGARDAIVNLRVELEAFILLATGVRTDELANIKNEHINGNILFIPSRKGGDQAELILHDEVVGLIRKYQLAKQEKGYKSEYLLVANGDKQLSDQTIRNNITELFNKIGRPDLTTHKTRTTYAMSLIENGEDIQTVQKLLGHNSIMTTKRYVDANDSAVKTANIKLPYFKGE